MFFNTTQEKNPDLFTFHEKAIKQDLSVLECCKKLGVFTPSRLWKYKNDIKDSTTYAEMLKIEPIGSVRRSLDTLRNDDKIVHVKNDDGSYKKMKSDRGRSEFLYQVV